jgi:hypothetical protein
MAGKSEPRSKKNRKIDAYTENILLNKLFEDRN